LGTKGKGGKGLWCTRLLKGGQVVTKGSNERTDMGGKKRTGLRGNRRDTQVSLTILFEKGNRTSPEGSKSFSTTNEEKYIFSKAFFTWFGGRDNPGGNFKTGGRGEGPSLGFREKDSPGEGARFFYNKDDLEGQPSKKRGATTILGNARVRGSTIPRTFQTIGVGGKIGTEGTGEMERGDFGSRAKRGGL